MSTEAEETVLVNGFKHSDEAGEEEEEEFHDAEDGEVEVEEEPTLIKKNVPLEPEDKAAVDASDRTEDQVPDITGTTEDKVDPMTTSVDEIEDLPAADDAAEAEDLGGDDVIEEDSPPKGDVPVEAEPVAEEEASAPAAEEEGAEVAVMDEEGANEEIKVETFEEQPPAEEAPAEEAPAEEPEEAASAEEAPAAEEPAAEEPAFEEAPVEAEEPVQEVPVAEEEPAKEEEAAFELQDAPAGRPRTPHELDNPPEDEGEVEIPVQVAPEEAAPVEESPVAEKEAPVEEEAPAEEPLVNGVAEAEPGTPKPASNAGSVPPTPKSAGGASFTEVPVVEETPGTPKSPGARKASSASIPKSPGLANGVAPGSPAVPSPKSGGGMGTPKKSEEFNFEEKSEEASPPVSIRSPKKTTFEDDGAVKSPRKRSPKSPRKKKFRESFESGEPAVAEAEPEPEAEAPAEEKSEEAPAKEFEFVDEFKERFKSELQSPKSPVKPAGEEPLVNGEAKQEEAEGSPPPARSRRAESPSPPPSGRCEPAPRDYVPYDQDSHRETVPPRNLATSTSFSSWVPPERSSYQAISPWVSTEGKYRNEYTTGVPRVAPTAYTSFFDDLVSTGPFSSSLYATSRLLERSRSRTRERRTALRHQRSSSNYYRMASQYPAPLRTRDYSTPPTSAINRAPSRYGSSSFVNFLEYSGAKQYDLARFGSRGSLYDSNQALSRASSRGNVDYYVGGGRLSRVDSYVNNLNSRYEWSVPSNYDTYRSASRSHINYSAPVNGYMSYTNYYPWSYLDTENPRYMRSSYIHPSQVRGAYEGKIDDLQRSLSRERYARDRLRTKYTMVASQLEQACKQMDLLRTNSYSTCRSGSTPRTSIYSHFYPYY